MAVLKKVLFFALFALPLALGAQSIPGITQPVTFILAPNSPQPNQTVIVTAQSFSTDLDKAVFTWSLNGKVFAKGTGLKSINVPGAKNGVLTTISASVSTTDIGVVTNSVSFRPVDVTLVWESDAYVPPFYKGKGLEAYNGVIKVTALPEFFDASGKKIDSKTLIYTWKRNNNVESDASGYGKDFYFDSQSSYLRGGEDIGVEVSSPKQNISGSQSMTIAPVTPSIVFYENSPLYGIRYDRALGDTFNLINEEITLRAEPFNFSTPISDSVNFTWTMNGAEVPQFADRNEITLRRDASVGGASSLSVLAQHQRKVLQGAQSAITLRFDAKK